MVFEKVVADLLNIYLGDYVENLDRSQLQIGIWGGDVILQDLVLRPNVFDELHLPLKCIFGHLGKLILKIPWKNLYSSPVIAHVERLFILAVPDSTSQKQSTQQDKQAQLQKLELAYRLKKEAGTNKTSDTFVEKLATQIVKNLQIHIQDIHIRYEDETTNPDCPFSVGITLHNLSIQTTDSNWRECIVQDKSSIIYKVLNLDGFAVYWNCHCELFSHCKDIPKLLTHFQNGICSGNRRPEAYTYVLGPITSSARLQLNPKPERDDRPFAVPKIFLTLVMEELHVGISKTQYLCLLMLIDFFANRNKIYNYQKFKPKVPKAKGHYKEWWKFAMKCIVNHHQKTFHWEQVKKHRAMCRSYAAVYMKKLQSNETAFNMQEVINRFENELDVFNIMLIRRQVEAEFEWLNQKNVKEQKPQGVLSWIGGWWSGNSSSNRNDITEKLNSELTAEERIKLYQAIDYEENAAPAHYPEDFVERQFVFQLGKLILEMKTDTTQVLLAELSGVSSSLDQRPSVEAFKTTLRMSHLCVWGANQGNGPPQLIKSITNPKDGTDTALMHLVLEINPSNKSFGRSLQIKAAPLQLLYDAYTIAEVTTIFEGPQSDILTQLQAAAGAQLSEMSALGLQYAIEQHILLEIDIRMESSYLLVPFGGSYSSSGDLLIINFGQLIVTTLPRFSKTNLQELYQQGLSGKEVVNVMRDETYDKYLVELKNVQVLLAIAGEDWKSILLKCVSSNLHVLEPTSLSCNVEKCLVQNDPSLPKLKVNGQMSTISLTIEDERLVHLLKLHNSILHAREQISSEVKNVESSKQNTTIEVIKYAVPDEVALEDILSEYGANQNNTLEYNKEINAIEYSICFGTEGVIVTFLKSYSERHKNLSNKSIRRQILQCKASQLTVNILNKTLDLSLTALLGGVDVTYSHVGEYLKFLDSSTLNCNAEMSNMLTIKYTKVKEDLGKIKYKQLLEIDFQYLNVLLHQEALLDVMNYLLNINKNLEFSHEQSKDLSRNMSQSSDKSSDISRNMKRKDVDLQLLGCWHSLHISLLQNQKVVAHLSLEGIETKVTHSQFSTCITARLKDLSVDDPNSRSIYKKIVSVLGNETLFTEVTIYHQVQNALENDIKMSLKANITRSRIVFLGSFVESITGFLSIFHQAQENLALAVAEAAETARKKVLNAHTESQFILLDVNFEAPFIVMPVNSTSSDAFHLDLGKLLVKNKLSKENGKMSDVINLQLEQLMVSRVIFSEHMNVLSERQLVCPVNFGLEITRFLFPVKNKLSPEIVMKGHFQSLEVTLDQDDVHSFMKLLSENVRSNEVSVVDSSILSSDVVETTDSPVNSALQWELALTMTTIKLDVNLKNNNQMLFTMSGLELNVQKKYDMHIIFRIQGLLAISKSSSLLCHKIITVKEEEVLCTEVILYDNNSEHDIFIKANLACIRVIYIPAIISSIMEFLFAFNYKPEKIMEAVTGTAEAAKQNILDAHNHATKVLLDINLKAPVIIVPREQSSSDSLLLDFGNFTIKNKVEHVQSHAVNQKVVIDNMSLCLKDLKISRVNIDAYGEVENECWLLQPVNMFMTVKRNLSRQTALPEIDISGNLKSVVVALNEDDIQMVMSILNNNLLSNGNSQKEVSPSVKTDEKKVTTSKQSNTSMKFTFAVDKMCVELFNKTQTLINFGDNVHDASASLSCWSLIMFVIYGDISRDGTFTTSLFLADCILEDSRKKQSGGLTRLMECKHQCTELSEGLRDMAPSKQNMQIHYRKKDINTEVKMHIFSFNLVLSLEYMWHLQNFISKAFEKPNQEAPKLPYQTVVHSVNTAKTETSQHSQGIFTFMLCAEKPDIFLVEDMSNLKATSLIFRSELKCTIKQTPSEIRMDASVRDLQLYSCCYHPDLRKDTMSKILQPCSVEIEGNMSDFEVHFSDIRLRLSPGILDLLNRVTNAIRKRTESSSDNQKPEINYYNIWSPKKISETDHWFLKRDGVEALELADISSEVQLAQPNRKERCFIEMPSIALTFEVGSGIHTLPMILLTAGVDALVLNWSTELNVRSTISLQMAYYNSQLALWEPLIEPVENKLGGRSKYKPWELIMQLQVSKKCDPGPHDNSSEADCSCTKICIYSKDNLELTLTKTCMEILLNLGQAFQMIENETHKETLSAPYLIKNHLGVTVSVLLPEGSFKESNVSCKSPCNCTLESGSSIPLIIESEEALSSPLSLLNKGRVEEKYLKIKVQNFETVLSLPVVQAGQRFFSLNEEYALISDVEVESGNTIVTLRSILQVFNNLSVPIEIHSQYTSNNFHYIGTVATGKHLDLPMNAVHTYCREIYISVQGYSKVCYSWTKDLPSVLHECVSDHGSHKERVFFQILKNEQQVYFKETNILGKGEKCYKIFVQPSMKMKNLLPVGVILSHPESNMTYVLTPGEHISIATMKPNGSKLELQIPDYREMEWKSSFTANVSSPEFTVLTFLSNKGTTLLLGMHSVCKQGVYTASLYCPYWILNKTGLPLSYKVENDQSKVPHHSSDNLNAVMFPSFTSTKKAAIQVADGDWSQGFSLDAAGSSGVARCPALGQVYELGITVQLMKCTLTKQVIITPFYIVINSCQHTIECQELRSSPGLWMKVKPGDCQPFWPLHRDEVKLRARILGTESSTVPFLCSLPHTTLLRLDNKWGGLNVDVHLTESSTYITFADYEPGQAAVLLVNNSQFLIPFSERGDTVVRMLHPGIEILYTWTVPCGERELDFLGKGSLNKEVCQMRKDASGSLELRPGVEVFWSSFLDGAQRVMLFSDDRTITEIGQKNGQSRVLRNLELRLNGVGLSLVDNKEQIEIIYMGLSRFPEKLKGRFHKSSNVDSREELGLWMQVSWLPHEIQIHSRLYHLQIDCQLPDCTYPVALAPVPPPLSVASSNVLRPFAELSAVVRKAKHSSLQQVQYCRLLVQAFDVKVDMGLLAALAVFLETGEVPEEVEVARFLEDFHLVNAKLQAYVAVGAVRGQKLYFNFLHLSPLKIHLSLSLSRDTGIRKRHESAHALRVLLHSLGVTLTNVQDVVFRLDYFERQGVLLSQQQLLSQAFAHYRSQVLKQLYVLVLGLDVLGNPWSFVKGLKQGVEDMFYEPIQGAIQGPEEFAQGLALGVRSLLGHTVGGAAGAMSRITGAVGSGVAALTFDKDYQRKRQEQQSQHSQNVQKDLAKSGKDLVMGVFDGVSGVFLKPISGAKKKGVEGFFKGVGQGVVGLVARPTAGIIDFASDSLDVVRRTAEKTVEVERQRPPRFLRSNGRVCPYVRSEAEGNKILEELENKQFAMTDMYEYHVEIESEARTILLLTDKRIMLISYSEMFKAWKLEWQEPWNAVQKPYLIEDGIFIPYNHNSDRAKVSKFSSHSKGRKVLIHNSSLREWLLEKIMIFVPRRAFAANYYK